jgi:HD-like signal output (HDOD) protein
MPLVKVRELVPGQVIATDVKNMHGQVILPVDTVVNQRCCSILKAWGIVSVAIHGETRENKTEGTVGQPAPPSATVEIVGDESHPALAELRALAARLAKAPSVEPGPQFPPAPGRTGGAPVSAQTVAQRAGTLASLPTIYFHVEKAINHPTSSAVDIAKVLGNDQALSARLLRIANSAFYGFPRRVEGVAEAVRIIGTRQLHDLVLATVVLTRFKGVDPRLVSMSSFWRHSLACGIAARMFATMRRETNTERFFVAGLLHDVGSLVLYQQFPDRAIQALTRHREGHIPLEEAERAVIGCDHGQVGEALMSLWKLPELYGEVAAHHHSPGPRGHTAGTATIHLADLLVMALGLGSNGEATLPRFSVEAWDLLGLPAGSLERTAEEVLALIGEAQRLFLGEEET